MPVNTKFIPMIKKLILDPQREDTDMEGEVLKIKRSDGDLPARINIVFSAFLKGAKCKLPMEFWQEGLSL